MSEKISGKENSVYPHNHTHPPTHTHTNTRAHLLRTCTCASILYAHAYFCVPAFVLGEMSGGNGKCADTHTNTHTYARASTMHIHERGYNILCAIVHADFFVLAFVNVCVCAYMFARVCVHACVCVYV